MAIYEKLLTIRKELQNIKKDAHNDFHHFDYVSSAKLLEAVREKMDAQGVLLIPGIQEASFDSTIKINLNYRWFDVESQEELIVPWFAIGHDKASAEYAFGKALTYSEKFFLFKFFQIPIGDVPEPDAEKQPPPKQQSPTKTGKWGFLEQVAKLKKELNFLTNSDEEYEKFKKAFKVDGKPIKKSSDIKDRKNQMLFYRCLVEHVAKILEKQKTS